MYYLSAINRKQPKSREEVETQAYNNIYTKLNYNSMHK